MDKVRKNKLAILIFMLPATVLFLGIIIIPIFESAYFSFLEWDGINKSSFIGVQNYIELFTSKQDNVLMTIKNAFLLALLSVFIQLPLALGLALLISRKVKGERFFITVYFIPVLLSTVVIGQLFNKFYYPTNSGLLNMVLTKLSILDKPQAWAGSDKTALAAVFVPQLWQFVGYHMLLMYAGVKSVSPDVIEAATIDGATDWQISSKIIIPLLKPVIKICVIFAVTGSLKAYDIVFVMTKGNYGSEVPSTLMVKQTFDHGRYGYGSSVAMIIIFLCFFFAILIKKCFKTEDYSDEK